MRERADVAKRNDALGTSSMATVCTIALTVAATLTFYTGVESARCVFSASRIIHVLSGSDVALMLAELGKAIGLVALELLALALAVGPLQRLGATRCARHLLAMRKGLGIAAFLFATTHVALAVPQFASDARILSSRNVLGVALGAVALAILGRMTQTSTRSAMRRLGTRWKRIHALGGTALALAIGHFFAMETHPLHGLRVRTFALVVVSFAVASWSLRLLASTLSRRRALRRAPVMTLHADSDAAQ